MEKMHIDILELYRQENITLRDKSDWKKPFKKIPLKDWWHLFLPLWFWFLGLFVKGYGYWLNHGYTTVGGVVYCPNLAGVLSNPERYEAILRHERVHILDRRKAAIKYIVTYLLCAKGRAHWERRGYTQNMMVEFEQTGDVSEETIDWIVEIFEGPSYLYMDKSARPKIEKIASKIKDGTFQGLYPEVK